MKKVYVYILVITIVAIFSCKEEAKKDLVFDEKKGLKVEVTNSAGDKWNSTDKFLPLPFNVARGKTEDIIVLSERLEKGKSIDVKPIGAIRILQNDTLLTYIVSLPVDKKQRSITADDFDEFSTVYSGAKWIVEQYMLNRKNSPSVKLKSWENENFAIKYLLK